MSQWVYRTGTTGTSLTVTDIANKNISGRVYRDGIEYRPSGETQDGLSDPINKEYKYEKPLGRLTFAFPFDNEQIDIPYEA